MAQGLGLAIAAAGLFGVAAAAQAQQAPGSLDKVTHIVVAYLENRSFDNMFGDYPGADGIAAALAAGAYAQRDAKGALYESLPAPHKDGAFDVSDNAKDIRATPWPKLPNRPFAIDKVFPHTTTADNTRDLVHRFYTNRSQISGGRNDRFVAFSDAAGLSMGYYSRDAMEKSALWRLARENTLLDRFFMGALGGSFLNHIYLVCACAPTYPGVDPKWRSKLDEAGDPIPIADQPGQFYDARMVAAADGDFAVNTIQSVFLNNGHQPVTLPAQTQPTIGDRLTDKGVDWAWYSEGVDLAAAPNRTEEQDKFLASVVRFQWHHQAFHYFARFDPTTPGGQAQRLHHLRDAARLEADIRDGRLPPVTFYKPSGPLNQHPGYANLDKGDAQVARIAAALDASPMKGSYVLIVTYDENGGFWDHAAPPMGPAAGARADFLGPGSRVPAIVVSPFARKGEIDHTEYDTGSVLKFITERHALAPLPSPRVQAVNSLSKALRLD